MQTIRDTVLFASDAELLVLFGVACLVPAVLAGWMDRRRQKRGNINRVGWVPWLPISLSFGMIGCGLLALGVPVLIKG